MSDALKLALRISAIDLFSGVLRHFRNEVAGTGAAAKAMQRDYDNMVRNASAGLKSLAVGGYLAEKLKPAVEQAADLQESLLAVEGILQGAHPNAAKLGDEMDRVRANSIEVARHMKYSATAVTDVTKQLVQAGVPLDAILESVDKQGRVVHGAAYMTEVLAETKGVDPSLMAQNVAKVAHSFGVPASGYGKMIDDIARASTLGSADPTELFYNLNQSGAIAHNLGHMTVQQSAVLAQALAPLGGESPAAVKSLLDAMTGAQARGYKWQQRSGFNFFDKHGNFIGLDAGLAAIHKRIHGLTEKQQDFMLGRSFGGAALPALKLLMAVGQPGVKSYAEMEKDYYGQPGLAQIQQVWEKGANARGAELASTIQSTEASLFDPLLKQLTAVEKMTNEWAGALGDLATKHPAFAKGVSYTAEAGLGVAAGYGIFRLIKAAGAGSSLLKNFLAGTGNVATGVAEGKAIEKFTGVAPVFVTNWPASGLGGLDALGEQAAGSLASKEAGAAAGAAAAEETLGTRVATFARGAGGSLIVAMALAEGIKAINAPLAADYKNREKARASEDDKNQMHRLGLNAAQYAMYDQLETKDMPYGKWASAQPGHWWSNNQSPEAYEAAIIKMVRQTMPGGGTSAPVKLDGTLHIRLDQNGRMSIAQAKTNQPNVHMDVGTMLAVP